MFVIYPKKVVFVRLELTTFTLQHDALPTPSHYSMMLYQQDYVELIVFSIHGPDYIFTAGKYIHEATIIVFVAQKKKKLSVRLELTTFTLQHNALPHPQKKREVVFVRLELLPVPQSMGAKSKQTFNSTQTDILRTQLCGLAQAHPKYR